MFSVENTRDTEHNFLENMFPSLFYLAGDNYMRGFPFFPFFCGKKKDFHGAQKKPFT